MDRFRKTFSVRKKMESESSESSKPQLWIEDEKKIKGSHCSFQVKYLGCIEVFESRGMQVCEEAIKALRKSKKKAQRAILYISGDALRVADEISKHLIVDQTIEKVSFCAPDRGHDKGFAYICRDGATRRWMCHAFLAFKESGERLSHAVGCAFAICLERKQKREHDALQVTHSNEDGTFGRMSSFRQTSLSDRLLDPQSAIVADPNAEDPSKPPASEVKVNNGDLVPLGIGPDRTATLPKLESGAIPRRHANPSLIERQTSLRLFPKLQETTSPFKHNLSMRSIDLSGSTLPRTNLVMKGATIPEETLTQLEGTPSLRSSINTTPSLASQTPQPANFAVCYSLVSEITKAPSPASPLSFNAYSAVISPVESDYLPATDPFSAAPFNPATIQQHQASQQQQQLMSLNNFSLTATSPIPPYRISPVFTNASALFPLSDWPDVAIDSGSSSRFAIPSAPASMEIAHIVSFPTSSELSLSNPVDSNVSHLQVPSPADTPSTLSPSSAMVLFGAQLKCPTQSTDPPAVITRLPGTHWPNASKPTNFNVDPFDLNWADQATAMAKGQLEAFVSSSSLTHFHDLPLAALHPSDAGVYTNPFLDSDKRRDEVTSR